MSRLAVAKVKELYERNHHISIPVDMDKLTTEEGCILVEWPFLNPVKEVKQGRWIGIAQGLSSRDRRHLIAHALGHHLMHCGNQLSFHGQQQVNRSRQEREAEAYAAHLLMPGQELDRVVKQTVWEIAEYFDVPEELARQRITDFAMPEELERWEEDNWDHASGY